MSAQEHRQAEVQDVMPETASVNQGEGGSNSALAEDLGIASDEDTQAIADVWAWMTEGDDIADDPCAPSPIFPIDPAQREAQGLPPSGMPGEECAVEDMEFDELEPLSPEIQKELDAEREAREKGESRGRSRGGGGDSIRWRTKDPNHPSPYGPPTQGGAPMVNPPTHTAPMVR